MFLGNILASGVIGAIGDIKSKFTGALEAGVEYNKEMQNLSVSLNNFTNGNQKLNDSLVDNIKNLREESGYSIDTLSLLTKKTYGLEGSADGAKKLSDAFVNLGRATGKSDDAMQNIITKFTQMNASGEITSGSITKMEKTLPGFAKTLSTTMGVSRDKLNELAKDGKISMSDLSKTIENMSAAKPKGLENYLTSFDGFSAHLQEKYQSLSGKITEGFFKTNNNFLKNMSKSLDGEETEKAFTHIGDSANKAVTTISTAFGSVFKGTKNPLADFANGLANEIEKLGNFISKHANDIKNFFGMVKDLGGAAFKLIGDTLKTVIPWLEKFGTWVSKHPEDVKKIALAIIGINVALKGTLGFLKAVEKFKEAKELISGFGSSIKKTATGISGLFIKPRVDGSDAKRELGIISKAAVGVGKGFKWTGQLAIKGITKTFSGLTKLAKTTGKGLAKAVSFTAKVSVKAAQLALTGLLKTAKLTGTGMKLAFNFLKANPFILIITGIVAVVAAFVELYKHNKKFRDFINGIAKAVSKWAGSVVKWFKETWDDVSKGFNNFGKSFSKVFNSLLGGIKKAWNSAWSWIGNVFNKYIDVFKSVLKIFTDFFTGKWGNLGKDIQKIWNALWGFVESIFGKKVDSIKKGIEGFGTKIWDTFNTIKTKVSDFWKGMWDGLVQFGKDGINSVIDVINNGIGGINGVIHTFGGSKNAIGKIPKLANGTKGAPKGVALINDAPGEHYQEAVIDNSGQMHVLEGRNRLVNFQGGETVVPAHAIPHFENGTPDWLSSIGSWIKDKWDGLTEMIKHPIKTLTHFMTNAISGISGSPLVTSIAPALGNGFVNAIVDPIKKLLGSLKKKHEDDGGGSQGSPSGSGVQRWAGQVKEALAANGLSTSQDMIDRVLRQIASESSGNEKAVQGNIGDINNITGDLAKGLMQTISSTFNANKFPGHGDIFNGYDNLLAALNYAKKTYGPSLSFLGNGHGYENGGLISSHGLYEIGEGNKPEMVIPLSVEKNARANQLLAEANQRINGGNSSNSGGMTQGVSQIITLLSNLLETAQKTTNAPVVADVSLNDKSFSKQLAPEMRNALNKVQSRTNRLGGLPT
ncbi:hypothetical protein RU92_GL000713 [Lactococcus cremoris subsp. tructae]|uniref:Uncharacterized protein n=1 Tax=Lactococcus cremoris subsp. tructae TaxID=542833 RepID=A0A2A5SYT9_LACLC|nr:tape measure protein [Lactococcus cremoris]PCS21065.1 hypothetical protein RU92_GL000713 [Lactococcus cremoris subsp. tructae]